MVWLFLVSLWIDYCVSACTRYPFTLTLKEYPAIQSTFALISDKKIKKYLATALFKQALNFPNPELGSSLDETQKLFVVLAFHNGADCNSITVKRNDKRFYVTDFLISSEVSLLYQKCCFSKVQYLLELGAIRLNKKDEDGFYPILFAKTEAMLRLLLFFGASINKIDYKGRNLGISCCGYLETFPLEIEKCIDFFYENNGNVHACDKEGGNILDYIMEYGIGSLTLQRLKILMDIWKIEPTIDRDGNNLFHGLAINKFCFVKTVGQFNRLKSIVEYLQEKGVDITQKNFKKKTPYSFMVSEFSDRGQTPKRVDDSVDSRMENHILFTMIVHYKLLLYSNSFDYQKRISS